VCGKEFDCDKLSLMQMPLLRRFKQKPCPVFKLGHFGLSVLSLTSTDSVVASSATFSGPTIFIPNTSISKQPTFSPPLTDRM
jgi:hypothetical protein